MNFIKLYQLFTGLAGKNAVPVPHYGFQRQIQYIAGLLSLTLRLFKFALSVADISERERAKGNLEPVTACHIIFYNCNVIGHI